MQRLRLSLAPAALALLLAGSFAFGADQNEAGKQATVIATARTIAQLLPDKLAGVKATGEIQQFGPDNLAAMVGEKATVYQEYLVIEAYWRQYGPARVEIFQTENAFAAFGLYTYATGKAIGSSKATEISEGSDYVLWRDNYFAHIMAPGVSLLTPTLGRAVSDTLAKGSKAVKMPLLMESLPRQGMIDSSQRYFLGPESLNDYVERGRDMFGFAGDAEAALAEYAPKARLLIVEYHTPEFAADAHRRINSYIASLSEEERDRIIVKRQGNYIVNATNFDDREFARGLIDSVEYPYTVKLLNPDAPMNDPFAAQKAARMLMSTFSIIGLTVFTVLFVGSTFGAMIFLKRRKRQREIFSDAGGMLRLDLDPFETVMLGLPPKKNES
ncbi:MAG TPA: DUF6599 family protein [Blastocatellia bacterium]|nr:DUF6599 family protein [Blastocatellia bacterium]